MNWLVEKFIDSRVCRNVGGNRLSGKCKMRKIILLSFLTVLFIASCPVAAEDAYEVRLLVLGMDTYEADNGRAIIKTVACSEPIFFETAVVTTSGGLAGRGQVVFPSGSNCSITNIYLPRFPVSPGSG